jgi:hypothetical protein
MGERIRDKFAVSRRKGMWMAAPSRWATRWGSKTGDHADEADRVRMIF